MLSDKEVSIAPQKGIKSNKRKQPRRTVGVTGELICKEQKRTEQILFKSGHILGDRLEKDELPPF